MYFKRHIHTCDFFVLNNLLLDCVGVVVTPEAHALSNITQLAKIDRGRKRASLHAYIFDYIEGPAVQEFHHKGFLSFSHPYHKCIHLANYLLSASFVPGLIHQ